MKKETLYSKLIEYSKDGRYPFHMPGHKRNCTMAEGMEPFAVDITEIDEFDNLHHAEGIIKEAMDNAADFFGTDKTWFLVNGSTCGLLAAIHSVTDIGDKIIIGRNCHKAVYNAVELRNLKVQYLYPEYIDEYAINGGYSPAKLELLLNQNPDTKAVVVTSPTYDGIVSDIEKIAEVVHKHGAVLIVDEAHGAHFGITEEIPKPAYELGADIVIESVHKTLPSLTQTALLHSKEKFVNKIEDCLSIYESSSPSYVLMASIDRCIRQLQTDGKEKLKDIIITCREFRQIVNNLQNFSVPGKELIGNNEVFDIDETKLVICINNDVMTGKELMDILRKDYNFEMEMEGPNYVLGIVSMCDKKEEVLKLAHCLELIDKELKLKNSTIHQTNSRKYDKINFALLGTKQQYTIYEAKKQEKEVVCLKDATGQISAEYVYLYPPGIPLLVPGEVISDELLKQIQIFKDRKMNIQGLSDKTLESIHIIKR